jgi:hypothetical protein
VRPFAADRLPALDPMQSLPFPAGGTGVVAAVRDRIGRLAERQASEPARRFVERMRGQRRRPVWLSLRLHRTALNQQEALTELACALLANGACAIVFDGYSRPHDYAANPAYDKPRVERIIAGESALVGAVLGAIGRRLGPAALEAVLPANGWDLLDSVYLARQCAAYFANHGTLQHKIGYFTRVPGLVHANPAILASDRAAAVTHVIEDPGAVEYIDPSLVADAPAPGGAALHAENDYRFTDIPRLVATFLAFLERHGRDGR